MEEVEQPMGGTGLPLGHHSFIPNEGQGTEDRGGFPRGFLLGLAFGALVTLFFTPKTGEEAREQVQELFTLLKERAIGMMTGETAYQPDAGADPVTDITV